MSSQREVESDKGVGSGAVVCDGVGVSQECMHISYTVVGDSVSFICWGKAVLRIQFNCMKMAAKQSGKA